MREHVFDPLDMNSTVAERAELIIPDRAEFYDRSRDGTLTNAPTENYSYKWAGGGFLSTSEDLVRFGMALTEGEFIKPSTLPMLFESQKTGAGEETGYGMGWRPGVDNQGRAVVHHGGSSEGARAFLLVYPRERLVVSFLANLSNASILAGEAETIAQLYLADGEMRDSPGDGLEGMYGFSATVGGESIQGHLSLTRTGSAYAGWLSRFHSPNARIVNASSANNEVRFVVATPSGLANLWLNFEGDRFAGKWGWDKPAWDFHGSRIQE